jgi:hypothetical protein
MTLKQNRTSVVILRMTDLIFPTLFAPLLLIASLRDYVRARRFARRFARSKGIR